MTVVFWGGQQKRNVIKLIRFVAKERRRRCQLGGFVTSRGGEKGVCQSCEGWLVCFLALKLSGHRKMAEPLSRKLLRKEIQTTVSISSTFTLIAKMGTCFKHKWQNSTAASYFFFSLPLSLLLLLFLSFLKKGRKIFSYIFRIPARDQG